MLRASLHRKFHAFLEGNFVHSLYASKGHELYNSRLACLPLFSLFAMFKRRGVKIKTGFETREHMGQDWKDL